MKYSTQSRIGALLTVIVALLVASAAMASSDDIVLFGDVNAKPATRGPEMDKADIAIDNHTFFTLHTNAAGYTIAERQRILNIRLTEIISKVRMTDDAFALSSVRGKPTIYVGPYRLITVYPNDAEAAGMSMDELAQQWFESVCTQLPQVAPYAQASAPETFDVSIGGTLLFRLRDRDSLPTLRDRGAEVHKRLIPVVSADVMPTITIQAMANGDGYGIFADDVRILSATNTDAELAGLNDAESLAATWAENLRNALPSIKAGLPTS